MKLIGTKIVRKLDSVFNVLPERPPINSCVLSMIVDKYKTSYGDFIEISNVEELKNLTKQVRANGAFEDLARAIFYGKPIVLDEEMEKVNASIEFLLAAGLIKKAESFKGYYPTLAGVEELKHFYPKSKFWYWVVPILIPLIVSIIALVKSSSC
jgi:hypothetical protein